MPTIRQTKVFAGWLRSLRDQETKRRIAARLVRVGAGLLGDVKPVGAGVSELRIDHGPGYRIYFVSRGEEMIVLLCGGDKKTQDHDIATAKAMAKEL